MDPEKSTTEISDPTTWFEPIIDKTGSWMDTAIAMLPNLFVALVVLAIAWPIAKWIGTGVRRLTHRLSAPQEVATLVGIIARTAGFGLALFLALTVLQLDQAVTSMLAGLGVAGLALGFALQDIAGNFMSGLLLVTRRPFEVGHDIETNGFRGIVRRIDLRATQLENFTGELVTIPNKQIFQNPITNYESTQRRRVDVEVGVGYDSDLTQVKEVTQKAIEPLSTHDKGVDVYFTGFGGSSINLIARVWLDLNDQATWLSTRSRVIEVIHEAYAEAGIDIPFPIRTLEAGATLKQPLQLLDEQAAAAK